MSKKLPTIHNTAYEQDDIPDPSVVGKRVYWAVDDEARYGTIVSVQHKNIVVRLEKRWNHRATITLTWRAVRLALSQSPQIQAPRTSLDPERINTLRDQVTAIAIKKPTHLTHYNELDAQHLIQAAHATDSILKEYASSIEMMKSAIHRVSAELEQRIDEAIGYGIDPAYLPDRPIWDNKSKRKKNDDVKRRLTHVREQTRSLLVALLVAAGSDGVTSEEVVAVLCNLPRTGDLPITQHRVMGMLSAFSRRAEAHLLPSGKWCATSKLEAVSAE